MKRQLKFRAWDGKYMQDWGHLSMDTGEVYECSNGSYGGGHFDIPGSTEKDTSIIEVMQFIGKRDCTGKDIYEGDILQCELYLGEVKFSTDSSFVMAMLNDGRESSFTHHEQLPFHTVIGNIYEGYQEISLT